MTSQPDQEAHLQLDEFRHALAQLPNEQREAVVLVGGAGLSYEDAAKICELRGRHHQEPGLSARGRDWPSS